jgi:hypothetical protein
MRRIIAGLFALLNNSRTTDSRAAAKSAGFLFYWAPRCAACALLSISALKAETWNGTLVDVMCKGRDLAGHTRQCALDCAKSGFGLVLPDGKFLKLDEEGNAKALAALKASNKEKDLKAKVTGTLDQDAIQVETIELQ